MDNIQYHPGTIKSLEEKKLLDNLEKQLRFRKSVKYIALAGVGAGLYGFKLGRRAGYSEGVKDGHMTAIKEMVDAWKTHTETMLKSRGE